MSLKIAIIGVGAIGAFLGARLAEAGEDVTLIARGANLEALRTRGIRFQNLYDVRPAHS
jgi:2-dehydropantoate 2-reductase